MRFVMLLSKLTTAKPLSESEKRHLEQRSEIGRLIAIHELSEAAKKYQLLLKEAPDTTLNESHQLDVANKLYAQGESKDAALAYELFLARFKSSHKADEVRLLLGILYARKLNKPKQAKELIEKAKATLHNQGHAALADQLLSELES